MVFGLLAGLLSLVSSSLVYVVGAIFLSKSKEEMIIYFVALVALLILLFLIRLFFPKYHNLRNLSLRYRMHGGHSNWGFRRFFHHEQQRQVVNGSVARILAFGFILYTFQHNLLYVYFALGFAFIVGVIMMLGHRSKAVDLVFGALLGVGVAYLSITYTSLLMRLVGL